MVKHRCRHRKRAEEKTVSRLTLIACTVPRLGFSNVLNVVLHKLRLKLGWRPQPLRAKCPDGGLFDATISICPVDATQSLAALEVFGWHHVSTAAPPDWQAHCLGGARLNSDQDCMEALAALGSRDVKPYWELSRFYWLPQFALMARDGNKIAAATMEHWLRDWIDNNPPFRGINWACGQEAAIRLMNLALSALIMDQWRTPSPVMQWLIETHARRIYSTLNYAIAQDNNHGTAEACALFIAGTWGQDWKMSRAAQFARTGRKWINNRALRVILPDGSPCQYSVTYHRANLEGFCMAGLWSERTGAKCLHDGAVDRVIEGARWLYNLTDPMSGDVPNLGANDGSHLFSVPQTNYRDFRPTVALVAAMFADAKPWPHYSDARIQALAFSPNKATWPRVSSYTCPNGGFHILKSKNSLALMHYPRFRFRPSQADILHIDLWHDGVNLLRDSGTYSYGADGDWFTGTAAHNTVQFDGRDQMPRIGRFLFGGWLKAKHVAPVICDGSKVTAGAAYTDAYGASHHRVVTLSADSLICIDTITGNFEEACLRWRTAPGDWYCEAGAVRNGQCAITIEFDGKPISPLLGTTVESRYYLQKTEVPEISVKINRPGLLVTRVFFRN
jgi:hypothetical protein